MTFVRMFQELETQNLNPEEVNTIFELTCDRNENTTGGFLDNFDDSTTTDNLGNSPTPFKIHYYRVRVAMNQVGKIWSSQVDNLRLAKTAPGGVDTAFTQRNMANNIIKKWTLMQGGYGSGRWAYLGHEFTKTRRIWNKRKSRYEWKRSGKPLYLNDAAFKVQVENNALNGTSDANYRSVVEVGLEYDATSIL